jgi:hypothetical protein
MGKDKDKDSAKKRKHEAHEEGKSRKQKEKLQESDVEDESSGSEKEVDSDESGQRIKKGGATIRVRVQVCREAEGTTGSMLACFSDAPPPAEDLLSAQGIRFSSAYQEGETRFLRGETRSLIFEGCDSGGDSMHYKYMVGLYDPDKGEVVVVDPGEKRSGNIVQLTRNVKSVASRGDMGGMTREQAREALVDGFGSKRVRSVHKLRKGQELEKEANEAVGGLDKELEVKKEETGAILVEIAFFFLVVCFSSCLEKYASLKTYVCLCECSLARQHLQVRMVLATWHLRATQKLRGWRMCILDRM